MAVFMNVFGTFLASYGKLPRQELEIPTHETNMNMKTDCVTGGRERDGARAGRSRLSYLLLLHKYGYRRVGRGGVP